jgi:hypothetical protein
MTQGTTIAGFRVQPECGAAAEGLQLGDLSGNGLIVGVTDSGKTNTGFQLLARLAENDIPFLVIDSDKSEYRKLLRDARFKRNPPGIMTIGDESLAPLRFNPFEVPRGVLIQTHIDYIVKLFAAVFFFYPPMGQVLQQSIEEIYVDYGWDLASNGNSRAGEDGYRSQLFPVFDDLVKKIIETINKLVLDTMYPGERDSFKEDMRMWFTVRLSQMQRIGGNSPLFETRQSLDEEALFDNPCIVELGSLISNERKAFLIGLLLIRLYEYRTRLGKVEPMSRQDGREPRAPAKPPYHVTLIEDPSSLLRHYDAWPSEGPDPRVQPVDCFTDMIAEMPVHGESIVMIESYPTKLVPDAIKNTDLKIVHRLVAEEDRMAIGYAMNLRRDQFDDFARLQKGQAIVGTARRLAPVRIDVEKSDVKEAEDVSDEELRWLLDHKGTPPL